MADESVRVRFEAETSGYTKNVGDAAKATEKLGDAADQASKKGKGIGEGLGKGLPEATSKFGRLSAAVTKHSDSMQKVGTTFVGIGLGLTALAVGAGKAAMDWESAWAGVMKTNEGTAEQTRKLETDLRALTGVLPATHTEIAAVAEAAGQLGVGIDDVAGFSKVMLDLGETTNLSADEAATALARFSNIMGTSFSDADKLGSTIVDLGNNFATTEQEIVNMSMRIAGVGRQMGMTEADVLAMATAMSSVGIEAEAGGTALTMVMKKIDAAVREGGDGLTGWAEAAGVSAAEFAEAWRSDPAQAMVLVTEGLGAVSAKGGDVNAMLSDLGVKGVREADTLIRLSSASGLLSEALDVGAEAWKNNTALAKEAELRYATAESKIAIAWNQIKDAAIDAGGAILPVVATFAEGVATLAQTFNKLPDPVKSAMGVLSGVAGVAFLALGGLLKLTPAAFETVTAFQKLAKAAPGAIDGLKKFGGVAAGLTIGVAAAAGLLAGLTALYNSTQDATMGVAELTTQLDKFRATGDATHLNEMFQFEDAITSVNGLGEALDAVRVDTLSEHAKSFMADLFGMENSVKQSQDALESLDQTLSVMEFKRAQEDFNALRIEAEKTGNIEFSTWQELEKSLPGFADKVRETASAMGLAGTDAELMQLAVGLLDPELDKVGATAEESAGGLDAAGQAMGVTAEEADALADALSDALRGLSEMGLISRDAQAANDAYQASLDAMTASIKENGNSLDASTEKGRNNRQAFRDLTQAGLDNAVAMAQSGAGHEELKGALMGTYNDLVANAQAMGLSAEAADLLARDLLEIPSDVNIETWMSNEAANVATLTADQLAKVPDGVAVVSSMDTKAQEQAFKTAAAIKAVPGFKKVDVAVSDNGTPGQVQKRINAVSGKEEFIFVTDDGTVAVTQQKIKGVDGKTEYIYVTDDGTVVATQRAIKNIDGTSVLVHADPRTAAAEAALARVARDRYARVHVALTGPGAKATKDYNARLAHGGVVPKAKLPGYEGGGVLPYTGLGVDKILGLNSQGLATAWVNDGEMVVQEPMTRKYRNALFAINRDDPSVRHLAGYAGGGTVGSGGLAAFSGGTIDPTRQWSGVASSVAIDYNSLAREMGGSQTLPSQVVLKVDGREFTAYVQEVGDARLAQLADQTAKDHRAYYGS